jgi:hypothetical protein
VDADVDELRAIAERLRAIDEVGFDIAADAAPELEKAARASAAAGGTPEGQAWKPTRSGDAPLKNAAGAITAIVSGTNEAVITLVLRGHHVFHHYGSKARKLPKREIFPKADEFPKAWREVIAKAARERVQKTMRGA